MTEAAPRLLAGRYRLGRRLGRGGMSEVHRAVDTRLGRPVAVKVFRSNADESSRRRFEDEARLLARLSHPGLVTVHDFGAESGDGEPYLVMQLVEGRTLTNVVEAGPLDPAQVLQLGRRLAEVLGYVHRNGIVHRDVKPSNVLITEDGQVFLADFGISRLADTVGRMTDSGIIMGSAHYMAPEQVRDQEIGYPADLYSLALVLLECLTGRAEYDGTKAEAAVARLTRRPRIPESLPEPLAGTLRAMTADDPDERPSAARCVQLLAGEIRPPEPEPAETTPARPANTTDDSTDLSSARRRIRWSWLGVLAVAVAVVLVAVFLLVPVESAPDQPVLPPAAGPAGADRLPADLSDLRELVGE
ncbi:serine/threonine-protein kinase [Saccharopolyspora gloriosae]|uniref:serine/threonine-protein kinase n=1 Tax=Saccharopolyspora gloriosae TaxID=455344 RepID=UPI001FB66B02|nr:serine/threonine-protein kinase [Saccharopolyspora gloriosae]